MEDMQIVPAGKQIVEAQHVEMMVPLYSYGCQRKLKNALSHLKGIYSVSVDHSQQKVTVWGICNKHDVLETVRCKRRGARFWNEEDRDIDEPELTTNEEEASSQLRSSVSAILTKAKSFNLGRSWQRKIAFRKVFARLNSL
ncbi:hypothetical protein MLD38_002975 [Melastoma candidum]|uniref:Uncharacterized protein n=1 Tax=Melastoma candidum TaxID=119954 RepID=A0ACB9S177_9MYRT|nr:hypothetical protein MLD38_002975 [Melastoma candidum]